MEKYEFNKILENLKIILSNLAHKIDLKKQNKKITQLTKSMEKPDFWNENPNMTATMRTLHQIQARINMFNEFQKRFQDLVTMNEFTDEKHSDFNLLIEELQNIQKNIKNFEIEILLNQPYDSNNAIITLHSGAGGTESQDWCEMLFRMYQKYAQKKNFKSKILYMQKGEEAGLKSISFTIEGLYAYGYLKSEMGVHRLIRVSPFDSNAKRHTSFASCEVLPEINEKIIIDLKIEDLKIDVFRSSGAGGQHVNTTDSAVRVTHLPTNIVVNCQNERSQIKNREKALHILKTKLWQLEEDRKKENQKNFTKGQKDISWGSQIRSYIFHPYQMVKDHRTNCEVFQINLVMDGHLDDLINAFLIQSINQ
ncbi:peptide chain release factor 2 [Candidatus Phytoplasma phoenicium]|uniref:Peptide chain release factor 2 n=1 Tax=Candidatus Phytoplasma phoenicium TaxID=198422 RepID=A0A0L0MK40_9MOLU|nr:peptide chain release factor 2 [Candidatus Phytoplasma phoenicium]KND62616.1 Peptide chain release factor 2 [Candidatus Phytoplasma phoenicium]